VVAGVKPPTATIIVAQSEAKPNSQTPSTLGATIPSQSPCRLPISWPQDPVTNLDKLLTTPAQAQLKRLGWTVTTLSNNNAVEEAVLGIQAPRILQFATHGYYLDCSLESQGWDNPLLRSGMVMAGVNTWSKEHADYYKAGKDILNEAQARSRGLSDEQLQSERVEVADGILTAYEVTGMNLQGTELVNLTACETGLGEVTPDGVAGLRQAFLLAGARSLTTSMWKLPAEETGMELGDFYGRWLGGQHGQRPAKRYEAFREALLEALKRARQTHGAGHPFYWAGVIYVGDPGDLPEKSTGAAQSVASANK
jgi:CHAT domain-containing protein